MCPVENKITGKKKKMNKVILKHKPLKDETCQKKCPQRTVSDTVKVWVLHVYYGKCDSRNILGVIVEAALTKDLHKIVTKIGMLNLRYSQNQFNTCS